MYSSFTYCISLQLFFSFGFVSVVIILLINYF